MNVTKASQKVDRLLKGHSMLYLIDGTPCTDAPAGTNGKGYPYVFKPIKPGARPTRQRLYTAEHLARRGIQVADEKGDLKQTGRAATAGDSDPPRPLGAGGT